MGSLIHCPPRKAAVDAGLGSAEASSTAEAVSSSQASKGLGHHYSKALDPPHANEAFPSFMMPHSTFAVLMVVSKLTFRSLQYHRPGKLAFPPYFVSTSQ